MLRQPFGFRDMERLRRDMDRLFESSFSAVQRQRGAGFPAMNVWTNKDEGIIVSAELPGFKPEDIEISATGDTLTLSGKRLPDERDDSVQYHRRERTFGEFTRTIQLPYAVNADKVEATMQHGVLQISLPRTEVEKPRQIMVKATR